MIPETPVWNSVSSFLWFSCSLSQQESPVTPTVAFLTSGEEERCLEAASEAAVVGEKERELTRVFGTPKLLL